MTLTAAETECLANAKARLASDERFPSADDYYACKDIVHELEARIAGKNLHEHDPMYFWFGRQSN